MDDKINYAPICFFTYNRLEETEKTVVALQNNFLAKHSDLFIFSDGWKNDAGENEVIKVRKFLRQIKGFENIKIFESKINKGLASSIIYGVTKILKDYDKVIVLEDDLITTPNFLDFMNQALLFYKNDFKIQSISGYSLKIANKERGSDVYFQDRAHSWSWGTWNDRWSHEIFDKAKIRANTTKSVLDNFKMNCGQDISQMLLDSLSGKINSWYVRWAFNHFLTNRYAVYPYYSKVENIGFNEHGTHCKNINVFLTEKDKCHRTDFKFINFSKNISVKKDFLRYFSFWYKFKYRLLLLKTQKGRGSVLREIKSKFS